MRQQDDIPTVPATPMARNDESSATGRETDRRANWAPLPQGGIAANLRKARVRAALFRKLQPIRIGRFTLLEPLGAGAMGEIYAAYDDQLDRKVALKLVRGGTEVMPKADQRLLREAQTLAQVSHPNVVQIYEAGTYNGRLFIAMELIRGKTLSSWLAGAEQMPRPLRQREILRQFIAAGRGLEAAHAAGLAHRDFKPDNVLVGDDGRVRVVDFGLARALVDQADGGGAAWSGRTLDEDHDGPAGSWDSSIGDELAPEAPELAKTVRIVAGEERAGIAVGAEPDELAGGAAGCPGGSEPAPGLPRLKAAVRLTDTGAVMGTPSYMAPETMRGAIADQRSDQFSFCVALYEALYDAFPFSGKTLWEIRNSMASGEVAFAPGVPVPAFVRKALYRGLSVESSQRFPGMTELLAALEPRARRLRGRIAVAGSLIAVAASALVALRSLAPADPCAAAGAAIGAPWSIDRQLAVQVAFGRSDQSFAGSAWRGVKTRIDDYASRWRDAATAACQATHVAHTQSAEQLDRRMLCLDRGQRGLEALVGVLGAGGPGAVEHAIEAAEALPELDACRRPEDLLFGLAPPPAPVRDQVIAVRKQLAHASALESTGSYQESLAIARDVSPVAKELGYPPVYAEALVETARALASRGTAEARVEAQRLYFDALGIAEAERHDLLAVAIWNELVALATRLDPGTQQAHAWWLRNAAAVHRIGDDAYEQAKLYHALGEIYFRDGKYAQQAEEERRAIAAIARAPAHQLELSRYDDALAKALESLGQPDEALRLHDQALTIATRSLGASHFTVIELKTNYGRALHKRGQDDRARAMLEDALRSIPASVRASHPDAAKIHNLLSDIDRGDHRLDSAVEHALASLAIYRRALSPDHVVIAEAYTNVGNVEFDRREFASALDMYESALSLRRRHLDPGHNLLGVTEGSIAETLLELERFDDAMAHVVEAERIFECSSARSPGNQAWMHTVHGELLVAKRRFAAASPVLDQALKLFDAGVRDPGNHALAMWAQARALHGLGRELGRARSLAEAARAIFAEPGAPGAYHLDAVARFLARLPAR